jgi:lipid-binding SYLF domain-containing protein
MKSFLILVLVLFYCQEPDLRAQPSVVSDARRSSVDDRLTQSSAALQTFRKNASDAVQMLLDNALCIGVAPRRDADQAAADAKGFVSCRSSRTGSWSRPAGVVIAGGGIFWPVYGSRIDAIVLTSNRTVAARFRQPWNLLGVDIAVRPGGVQLDQFPKLIDDPVVFAFEQSDEGISPLNIDGGTMTEDRAANAALYGKELSNLAVLSGDSGGRSPIAVDSFLAALPSASSTSAQPLVLKAE